MMTGRNTPFRWADIRQISRQTDLKITNSFIWGKGTAADYEGINVKGKLELWLRSTSETNGGSASPVYQAYLRGAAALIAVQANGYGEIAESALNAQDIAGPDFAPAFSLSQADARILKRSLRNKIFACEDNTTDSEDTHKRAGTGCCFITQILIKSITGCPFQSHSGHNSRQYHR